MSVHWAKADIRLRASGSDFDPRVRPVKAHRGGWSNLWRLPSRDAFGAEQRGTYWHYRRREMPYHIYYLFVPITWLKDLVAFELGDYDAWCASGLSDHAPLSAEFSDAWNQRTPVA
jgi:hypothetical protein